MSIERAIRGGRKRPLEINHDLYPAANPKIVDEESSVVDIATLNAELRCPICLRLMRDPMATECLHRFCKDCIEKCQRQTHKQCPSCRKPIATRRSLRPDPNMKLLIKKLYPDLEAFEAEEEEEMLANNKIMAATHLSNLEKQIERQRALAASMMIHDPPPASVEYEARSTARRGGGGGRRAADISADADGEGEGEGDEEYDDDGDDGDEGDEFEDDESEQEFESDGSYKNETLEYESWAFEGKGKGRAGVVVGSGGGSRGATAKVPRRAPRNPLQPLSQRSEALVPRSFELGFRISPHPDEPDLPSMPRDYVVVSCLATIEHILKFLAIQLRGNFETDSFALSVTLPDKTTQSLEFTRKDKTLNEVVKDCELEPSALFMQYRSSSVVPSLD